MLEISRWMMLHRRVDQLKLIAIKSRHQLRTINVLPCGRQPTYSKYPKQWSYWWKWKNASLILWKKTYRFFGQPNNLRNVNHNHDEICLICQIGKCFKRFMLPELTGVWISKHPSPYWWEHKLIQPYWRAAVILLKLLSAHTFDSGVVLLGNYLRYIFL